MPKHPKVKFGPTVPAAGGGGGSHSHSHSSHSKSSKGGAVTDPNWGGDVG